MRLASFTAAFLGLLCTNCGSPTPASLEFLTLTPATPSLNEIATVYFRALDSRGVPMGGVEVEFSLASSQQGVTLSPAKGVTNKDDGVVQAQLVASSRISSAVVVARVGELTAFSPQITIAGGSPSARQLTFQCGRLADPAPAGGIHGILAYNESRSLIAGVLLRCDVHVADRTGEGVVGAQVSFLTEAGYIDATATTIADAATKVASAAVLYATSYPLPKDVAPVAFTYTPNNDSTHTGEYLVPLWMEPWEWWPDPIARGAGAHFDEPFRTDPLLPGRTNNPRDNLVALVAVTAGEEAFDDVNNNGRWDTGEPFGDTTEPFVDANDNATWDSDERFVDTNANGLWDAKNGAYDASTLIWTQERILWTGLPSEQDVGSGRQDTVRVLAPTTAVALPHYGGVDVRVAVSDPWFNSIARNGDGDGCTIVSTRAVTQEGGIGSSGIRLSYPPTEVVGARVSDAHDPSANEPPNPAPVPWDSTLNCSHTASPLAAFAAAFAVNVASGTVP